MVTLRILLHEWRVMGSDPSALILVALISLTTFYAAAQGARHVRINVNELNWVEDGDRNRLADLHDRIDRIEAGLDVPRSTIEDPRRPHAVARDQGRVHAILPLGPLAATAIGQTDLFPLYVRIALDEPDPFAVRDQIENPLSLLTGRFDLAFLVVFLLPLAVLALAYDLLSREREGGTLRLLFSQPITLTELVGGKLMARASVLGGCVLVTALMGLWPRGAGLLDPTTWALFGLWFGVVLAYLVFWLFVALAVNLFGGSSAQNAVVITFLWLIWVVVIPGTLHAGAHILHPMPSRGEVIAAEREALLEAEEMGASLLARHYHEHPELNPEGEEDVAILDALSLAIHDEVERRTEEMRDHVEGQLHGRRALMARFRFLSPALLAQEAFHDIAGTGDHRFRSFHEAVRGFHQEWVAFFSPIIYRGGLLTTEDLDGLPEWRGVDDPVRSVASRVARSIGGLLVLSLVVGVASVPAFLRFSVA